MSDEIPPYDDAESGDDLHKAIRKIAHDISNPLGVLQMASYFLKSTQDDKAKRERYLEMLDLNIDRIEQSLRQLRELTEKKSPQDENPGAKEGEI